MDPAADPARQKLGRGAARAQERRRPAIGARPPREPRPPHGAARGRGDTTSERAGPPLDPAGEASLDPFDAGFFVGLLVGEGHFGGDGRQAHITLRMHVDHEAVFRWLVDRFPGSRLYGPYDHSGRRYYQWMARSAFLRDAVIPLLDRHMRPEHSERVWRRYQAMKRTYRLGTPQDMRMRGPDDRG